MIAWLLRYRAAVAASSLTVGVGVGSWSIAEEPNFAAQHQEGLTEHWVQTADGAWVWMQRRQGDGPPVVLCHGISSNHHFWDLQPDRSLAIHLNEQGYDVWNLDLRGHGPARNDPDGKRQSAGWTVDDYGTEDLPAAFAYVKQETGAEQLHYVGHSMGGMILAIYLSSRPGSDLASAAAVGSPLDFRDPDFVTSFALHNAWAGTILPFVPTPMGAGLVSGMRHAPFGIDDRLFNPALVSPTARENMYERVVSPMSRGEIKQFSEAGKTGAFTSADGTVRYLDAIGEETTPMLFLAGRADRIAAADRVYSYYDAYGAEDKRFVVLSEANGFAADYGHLDFATSDFAAGEVFPLLSGWIEAHR